MRVEFDPALDTVLTDLASIPNAVISWSMVLPSPVYFGIETDPTALPGAENVFARFAAGYAAAITPGAPADSIPVPVQTRTYTGTGLQRTVTIDATWSCDSRLMSTMRDPDVTEVDGFTELDEFIDGIAFVPIIGPIIVTGWARAIDSLRSELSSPPSAT
jgi:hypothetical protein